MKTCGVMLVVVVLFAAAIAPASAVMMTFTETGSGTGTLSGVSFPMSQFVFTAKADSANLRSYTYGWMITNTSASISIAGLGTFGLVSGTNTFVNQYNQGVGFGRSPMGPDLFDGPYSAGFGTWNMISPIGPISGQGNLGWKWDPQINTTGGILIFTNTNSTLTFTAVPEPAMTWLLALGGWGIVRRPGRRRAWRETRPAEAAKVTMPSLLRSRPQ